ncbi:MAG: ABC transporter substrate-binding protein [Dehalococcoidia bacterium]|jgi:peptide/nickel transport system substrate-binding protein|nr:ABC transporter substrate-binding protein [Dehalococcoidia bacterium]
MDSNYWTRQRVGRRSMLRGAGLAGVGLAGAALIGCGGDDDDDDAGGGGTATAAPTSAGTTTGGGGGGPVSAADMRVEPGTYDFNPPASAGEADPANNAKYGGELYLRYLEPPRMDMNRTLSCTIYHTMNYTQNKLIRGKSGASADPNLVEIEGDLAESWEAANPEATEFVFNLKKGVLTHDKAPTNGREFTSEDVVATMEMYKAAGPQKDVYSPVESVEAVDPYTVRVKLSQPLADFPTNISSWSFMMMKELVDNDELRQEIAVGTGPFIQEEWAKNERSVFQRNPNYHEEGLPYLDTIYAQTQNDANVRRAGFITDDFFTFSARDAADIEDLHKSVDDMVVSVVPRTRGANVNGFQFQMDNPTFQDDRVRQGLSKAFDRNEYDLARNSGDNTNANGAYSNAPMPWPYLFDEYPDARANGQWYDFDAAEGRKMLQAAGYSEDSPLEMEMKSYYYANELSELVVPGINQNLPEVNITFERVDNPTHVTLMSDRNFPDTVGFLWGPAGYSMDQWIYPFYHSTGGTNYGNVNDPELDTMLEKQRTEADPDAQKEIWKQVYDRIHDKVYQAWFPEPLVRTAWHNYVMNHRPHGLMGTIVCYSNDQARSMWLDDGAPHSGR